MQIEENKFPNVFGVRGLFHVLLVFQNLSQFYLSISLIRLHRKNSKNDKLTV